jgi:hypothetical protein
MPTEGGLRPGLPANSRRSVRTTPRAPIVAWQRPIGRSVRERRVTDGRQTRRSVRGNSTSGAVVWSRCSVRQGLAGNDELDGLARWASHARLPCPGLFSTCPCGRGRVIREASMGARVVARYSGRPGMVSRVPRGGARGRGGLPLPRARFVASVIDAWAPITGWACVSCQARTLRRSRCRCPDS